VRAPSRGCPATDPLTGLAVDACGKTPEVKFAAVRAEAAGHTGAMAAA